MSSRDEAATLSGMRTRRAARLGLLLGAGLVCAGCSGEAEGPGGEPPPDPDSQRCQESTLTYQNFAAPFVITWCRGCHGEAQPVAMRQDAPVGVNFDTAEQVRGSSVRILARATGPEASMPPVGGPSDEERALLAEWIACGMK
jgi:uncharacterized membrane protein